MKNLNYKISIILFAIILLSAAIIKAAPGDLDTTFNGSGKLRFGFGSGIDTAASTATQADGKLIVVGGANKDFLLIRYNTDGSIDTTFGVLGKVITNLRGQAQDVKIQTDGKIVVVGYSQSINGIVIATVRYNANGSIDNSFSGDGIATYAASAVNAFGTGLAIQSDGKIVFAGYESSTIGDIIVGRLNTDGTFDTSFDSDGVVVTSLSSLSDIANDIGIQPDGKIVVCGRSDVRFAVVRYNTNGSLDTSFSGDGILTTEIVAGESSSKAYALGFQIPLTATPPKIVVTGQSVISGTVFGGGTVRYNSDGSLDTTFDTDGIRNESQPMYEVFVQNSFINASFTRIVVAGGEFSEFSLYRYTPSGTLDSTFDGDGNLRLSFGLGTTEIFSSVALGFQSGKMVVSGSINVTSGTTNDDFATARLNSDGSFDTAFNITGKRIDNVGDISAIANAVAIQSDNKYVVIGEMDNNPVFVRYNPDGSLDTSFSDDGILAITSPFAMKLNAVAIQPDGKIVACGISRIASMDTNIMVVRVNSNGTLDTSFSGDGFALAGLGIDDDDTGEAIAIQIGGRIVVAGSTETTAGNFDLAVVAFNSNGTNDTSFDGDGQVLTSLGTNTDVAKSVAFQTTDDKIVVAGTSGTNFAILRYNPNGSLDTTFSGDGIELNSFGFPNPKANAMKLQADGKIVVGGFLSNFAFFVVARFNTNGTPDNSFGNGGIVTTQVSTTGEAAINSLAIQGDGKIVAAGRTFVSILDKDFAVVRYNTDGSLDTSFANTSTNNYGNNGIVTTDLSGGGNDIATGIVIDSQNRAVVVGNSDGKFGLVRILGSAAPTAANVSISGKVFAENNQGLRNAVVTLTDSSGQTRTTRTTSFGYFTFEEIEVGQTVIIGVRSKRFQFDSQVVAVNENINDVSFVPINTDEDDLKGKQ